MIEPTKADQLLMKFISKYRTGWSGKENYFVTLFIMLRTEGYERLHFGKTQHVSTHTVKAY